MRNKLLQPAVIVPVLAALLGWGGWAYYVNSSSGSLDQALRSGVTQGIYSALMTFYMSFSVLFLYRKTAHRRFWFLLPTLITVGHTGLLLILVHLISHTHNILKTVALPLSVAVIYCLFLTKKFHDEAL